MNKSFERETIDFIDQSVGFVSARADLLHSPGEDHTFEKRTINARYELLRRIGQGGLGIVWLARDLGLNRYVALKEIKGDADDPHLFKQFRREAEITGRLEHPGIVSIHHFGCDESTGKAFYVMRFLGRRTFQDSIDEFHERRSTGHDDKLSFNRLLTSFVNVCRALGHAHDNKIIHRDLKPSNVAIDDHGQITLLDWGLAKISDATGLYVIGGRIEVDDSQALDDDPVVRVVGTPLYMAPEQASGLLEEIDISTDVYGLGGILYAILTGVGPHFQETTTLSGNHAPGDILRNIASNNVVPPKDRLETVPAELSAICMKSLSTKRYERYQSAEALAEEIERYLLGESVQAYQAPLKIRVAQWLRRHPTLTQMLLLAATLIVLGIIGIYYTSREYRSQIMASRTATANESIEDLRSKIEIEIQNLLNDVRFISDLQPIVVRGDAEDLPTGEIPTQNSGVSTSENAMPLSVTSNQYRESRYEDLFVSFLDSRPAYLSLARMLQVEQTKFSEVIRVERYAVGQRPKSVSLQKLSRAMTAISDDFPAHIYESQSGKVELLTNDRLPPSVSTQRRDPLVVTAIGSRFDFSDDRPQILLLELDLMSRLKEIVPAVVPNYISICITDSSGLIVFEYREGSSFDENLGQRIDRIYPGVNGNAFDRSEMSLIADGTTSFGKKIRFGRTSSPIEFGIIAFVHSF